MSSTLLSSLVGLTFLVGTFAGAVVNEKEWKPKIVRSCDLAQGTVCIPTACTNNACSLFKDAVCVPDRCGCEARFFNWIAKESIYSDVSKMCSSGNFVINFLNFTAVHVNESSKLQSDEDQLVVRKFFKEFNLLVTEILKDITDYLRATTEATPTQANIDKLKDILRTLNLRSKMAKLTASDEDLEERKIKWGSLLNKVARVGVKVGEELLFDEVADEDIEAKNLWGTAIRAAFKIGKALLSDEDQDIAADIEVKSFLGKLVKGAFKVAKELLFDADGVTPSSTGKKFAVDVKTLEDVLSDAGTYSNVIKTGKVAISDKTAQRSLTKPMKSVCLFAC